MKAGLPPDVLEKAISRYKGQHPIIDRPDAPGPVPRVICISRECGSGGTSIATSLSERLGGWPVWDSQILHVLADKSQLHYQARMFESLDEKTQTAVQSALVASFGLPDRETYRFLLCKALAIIARKDAIIVGRGSDIIVDCCFRVRIRASLEARVRHMAELWKSSDAETRKRIRAIDEEREIFRRRLSRWLGKDYREAARRFDIEIDTDRIPYDSAAAIIEVAAQPFFARLRKTAL